MGQIRTSTDTVTWTTQTSNFGNTNIVSIAYNNGVWIAGGYSGQIRSSENKMTNSNRYNKLYSFNSTYYYYSSFSSDPILSSTNMSTWTTISGPTGVNDMFDDGLNLFALSNSGTLWQSSNGTTWTSSNIGNSDSLQKMAEFEGTYQIQGNNAVYSSTDLLTWTTVTISVSASTINDIIGLE